MDIVLIILIAVVIVLLIVNILKSSKANSGNDSEMKNSLSYMNENISRIESSVKDEISRNREEFNKLSKDNRTELNNSFSEFNSTIKEKFNELTSKQKELSDATENRLEKMRETVETKLKSLQQDNTTQLEKMRETVDEKLQSTLEKRLGDSFKIVSERLEKVHHGLGEMQNLATGVGDLKKVLTNVKTRGVFGEYQLENILEQLLTPEQYSKNVKTKSGSNALVEFAIKMPGREDSSKPCWLPLDAKFPTEIYTLLNEAYEAGDTVKIEECRKQLVTNIKAKAKEISDKYIDPPNTTDFGIMFLPFESLYAEVLRIPGLFEQIQRECKITITGPTTISALLNSLQMGFRTLAIGKRSSEVWEILSIVKTEFGRFGDLLEKTKKKLDAASSELENVNKRSRSIERKLRDVQELPGSDSMKLLGSNLDFESNSDEEVA